MTAAALELLPREAPQRARSPEAPELSERFTSLLRLCGVRFNPSDPRVRVLEQACVEGDPLADAVIEWMDRVGNGPGRKLFEQALERGIASVPNAPPALVALFEQLDRIPAWLDREELEHGARVMHRHGLDGLRALTAALMSGYLTANPSKPLVTTGALTKLAPQRLDATARFVHALAMSPDMGRFSEGFKTTVRVRMMHAAVRGFLSRSPNWRIDPWGVPINQRDMLITHLQFTLAYLGGVMAAGRLDTSSERESVIHRWRYVSYVLGIRDDLVPKTLREALEQLAIINATEPGPDKDGAALAAALVQAVREGPISQGPFGPLLSELIIGYTRFFLGRRSADALGIPDSSWVYATPALALVGLPWELAQLASPQLRELAQALGKWRIVRAFSLPSSYEPPTRQPYRVPA